MRYFFSPRFLLPVMLLAAGLGTIPFLTKGVRAQASCANYITSQQGDQPFDGVLQGSSLVTEEIGGSIGLDGTSISGGKTVSYEVGTYRDYSTGETVTVRCDTYAENG